MSTLPFRSTSTDGNDYFDPEKEVSEAPPNQQRLELQKVHGNRRLLTRDDVCGILQLSAEKVQVLINTRQITVFRIAGEEKIDSRDIDQLIDTYKTTALRRAK